MRRIALQLLVELARVGQRLHLEALFGQVAYQQLAQPGIVVDDQNFWRKLFHRSIIAGARGAALHTCHEL